MRQRSPRPRPSPSPPKASIRVVARRTGIAAATLRIWERRYGFPSPSRRSSGTRVYDEAQIVRLKLARRAIDLGFRAGEVVGLDASELERLLEVADDDVRAHPHAREVADVNALMGLLAGDELPRFHEKLRHAARALDPRAFVVELAHPLAFEIGESWAKGRLAIRHEHIATAMIAMELHALRAAQRESQGEVERVAVLATLPGERHGLALEMIGLYLEQAGIRVCVVGTDTPAAEIVAAARSQRAAVVGISATTPDDLETTRRDFRAVRKGLPMATALWIGGREAIRVREGVDGARVLDRWESIDKAIASV